MVTTKQKSRVGETEHKEKEPIYKVGRNKKDGIANPLHSNNYSKWKWIKFTNQKTESGWMHKKQDPTICC